MKKKTLTVVLSLLILLCLSSLQRIYKVRGQEYEELIEGIDVEDP